MKAILYCLLVFTAMASAAKDIFPSGCKPLVVSGEATELKTTEPTVVFLHNLAKIDLWITHPVSDPSASPGWSTRLETNHWSALALDKKLFELTCIESRPGHEQQVACSEALAMCQWTGVTMPSQKGTYWVGENLSLQELKAYIGQRGFELSK